MRKLGWMGSTVEAKEKGHGDEAETDRSEAVASRSDYRSRRARIPWSRLRVMGSWFAMCEVSKDVLVF